MFDWLFGRKEPPRTYTTETAPPPTDDPLTVRVWLHQREDGVIFVHPDFAFELLRKMMKGSAAGIFCDGYELTMRRLIAATREGRAEPWTEQTEAAMVGAEKESL
jgi:hypothetical protein